MESARVTYFPFSLLALASASFLSACQSTTPQSAPAVLASADSQTMDTVKSVLVDAMGVAQVELGPGDPTKMSTIAVLPPRLGPHEDRSTAKPALFDIVLKGSACFVVRRSTGVEYELTGVSCRPLNDD